VAGSLQEIEFQSGAWCVQDQVAAPFVLRRIWLYWVPNQMFSSWRWMAYV